MGPVVLTLVFVATLVIGALLARAVLAVVLALVTGEAPVPARALHGAVFVAALLAFWSLVPARAESPGASTRITLVR